MISLETTRQKLYDLLVAKSFDLTTRDAKGKETSDPTQADLFSFNYKVGDSNYGTVVVTVNPSGELEVFYGDVLGKGMESEDKTDWYDFLYQLRHFAKRNMLEFALKNMNKLKYAMQTMAQVTESKYYGFKKTSYTKPTKEAKLKIVHSKPIDEEQGDQRYRNVAALFVETADGERFKLPFNKLYGGRAMARHVSEGGNPYDEFGQYICELVSDINTLSTFTRYARGHDWQDSETAGLAERGLRHFGDIKRKVKSMVSKGGYRKAFEEFSTTDKPQQEVVERVRELFTERLLDQRVESALPVLAKLELEGKSMKEINEFDSWAESMIKTEGFDPESYEKEIEYEFAGDDGEPGYGHIQYMVNVVDGRPVVDPKSLKATCNGDGNNKLTDEWCSEMVAPGGSEHEEALLAAQEEAEDEWSARDADVPMEDNEKNYRQPGFNNPRKYTDDLGIMGKKDKMEEGKMKDLMTDIDELTDEEFEEKYKTKKPDYPGINKKMDEGKMKELHLDMTELSDEEFEEKYQSKKSDWSEVKNKDLRQDPDQPAYIGKMKKFAGDLAAEDTEVTEEYAPSVGDLIVTGKGTKGTVESVTDEAVEFRTETGKLLRTAVSNVQPDAVNEEDFEEGNEFTQALANAKRDGKKEFEVDGKVYKVEENYAERLKTLINW